MYETVLLNNFEEFDSYWQTIDPNGPPVYFFFSGSKVNGVSWCPDCVTAESIVKRYLSELNRNLLLVYVDCGDKPHWRDAACPFRTDSRIRLMQVPTVMKWKGVQRLEGTQCCKRELIEMVFEEEE